MSWIDADRKAELELHVNGDTHRLSVDARVTLLDALREHLHLNGTKKGCDHGQWRLHRAGERPKDQQLPLAGGDAPGR